ncbi:hypothetical protein BXZ70DRAFT_333134 [Cristinia sonorae]|uniref:Uncharacterized protein n=1 Tax=Cristinia sonorae TaxID=1940300 RepID=A0A8K0XNF2_9AGAR|nr:hypothetical protein BXZ70DRAFT_333134 [Cristinia sonorae]
MTSVSSDGFFPSRAERVFVVNNCSRLRSKSHIPLLPLQTWREIRVNTTGPGGRVRTTTVKAVLQTFTSSGPLVQHTRPRQKHTAHHRYTRVLKIQKSPKNSLRESVPRLFPPPCDGQDPRREKDARMVVTDGEVCVRPVSCVLCPVGEAHDGMKLVGFLLHLDTEGAHSLSLRKKREDLSPIFRSAKEGGGWGFCDYGTTGQVGCDAVEHDRVKASPPRGAHRFNPRDLPSASNEFAKGRMQPIPIHMLRTPPRSRSRSRFLKSYSTIRMPVNNI